MGYYSSVCLTTNKKGFNLLEKNTKQNDLKEWFEIEIMKENDKEYFCLVNNYCKWYSSYEEIVEFYQNLDKMTKLKIPFNFVRIGEDRGDIEEIDGNDYEKEFDIDLPEPYAETRIFIKGKDIIK